MLWHFNDIQFQDKIYEGRYKSTYFNAIFKIIDGLATTSIIRKIKPRQKAEKATPILEVTNEFLRFNLPLVDELNFTRIEISFQLQLMRKLSSERVLRDPHQLD